MPKSPEKGEPKPDLEKPSRFMELVNELISQSDLFENMNRMAVYWEENNGSQPQPETTVFPAFHPFCSP